MYIYIYIILTLVWDYYSRSFLARAVEKGHFVDWLHTVYLSLCVLEC